MEYTEMLQVASSVLNITTLEAEQGAKYLEDLDAWFFLRNSRSGAYLIINKNGEKLAVASSIPPSELKEAFKNGRRN
jgi:hypothetical protein